jgi:hypothetical protein
MRHCTRGLQSNEPIHQGVEAEGGACLHLAEHRLSDLRGSGL